MAISPIIGRQALSAAAIVGVLPVVFSPLSARASLLPPSSRAQLIHTAETQPSLAIPYVITPERRAMLTPSALPRAPGKGALMWDIA